MYALLAGFLLGILLSFFTLEDRWKSPFLLPAKTSIIPAVPGYTRFPSDSGLKQDDVRTSPEMCPFLYWNVSTEEVKFASAKPLKALVVYDKKNRKYSGLSLSDVGWAIIRVGALAAIAVTARLMVAAAVKYIPFKNLLAPLRTTLEDWEGIDLHSRLITEGDLSHTDALLTSHLETLYALQIDIQQRLSASLAATTSGPNSAEAPGARLWWLALVCELRELRVTILALRLRLEHRAATAAAAQATAAATTAAAAAATAAPYAGPVRPLTPPAHRQTPHTVSRRRREVARARPAARGPLLRQTLVATLARSPRPPQTRQHVDADAEVYVPLEPTSVTSFSAPRKSKKHNVKVLRRERKAANFTDIIGSSLEPTSGMSPSTWAVTNDGYEVFQKRKIPKKMSVSGKVSFENSSPGVKCGNTSPVDEYFGRACIDGMVDLGAVPADVHYFVADGRHEKTTSGSSFIPKKIANQKKTSPEPQPNTSISSTTFAGGIMKYSPVTYSEPPVMRNGYDPKFLLLQEKLTEGMSLDQTVNSNMIDVKEEVGSVSKDLMSPDSSIHPPNDSGDGSPQKITESQRREDVLSYSVKDTFQRKVEHQIMKCRGISDEVRDPSVSDETMSAKMKENVNNTPTVDNLMSAETGEGKPTMHISCPEKTTHMKENIPPRKFASFPDTTKGTKRSKTEDDKFPTFIAQYIKPPTSIQNETFAKFSRITELGSPLRKNTNDENPDG